MKKSLAISLFVFYSGFAYNQELNRYKKLPDTLLSSKFLPFKKKLTVFIPSEFRKGLSETVPLIIIFDSQNRRS